MTFIRYQLSRVLMRLAFLFPDRIYLHLLYYLTMGKRLHLGHPVLFSEKLQWLKLNQKNPKFTMLVDKLEVKDHVRQIIGSEYVCPTLETWDDAENIDFGKLPDKFVLKTTHGGGNTGVVVCHNKNNFDHKVAKKKLVESMNSSIFNRYREWPYKNVKRRIIAEEYLGKDVMDYKFYCCNGEVACILLCTGRQSGEVKYYFLDTDWNIRPYNEDSMLAEKPFPYPAPSNLDKMLQLARKLSEGFPFVRIDLYNVDGHIYFGEYTFYPASGIDPKKTLEFDKMLGEKIHLPIE
ncbi:MAG: glycosyl transferase [Prevotella sp.]|nr:glycosyl transferase [Prevotella sp.]